MSLATLQPKTQQALNALVEKFNNKKDWLITEFTTLYKLDPAVTPEHVLVGLKGKQNVGTAYAAWYVFKSGITADKLNITFIHDNYSEIDVKSNSDEMSAELARVKASRVAEAQRLADLEAQQGTAFLEAVNDLTDAARKALKVRMVASSGNTAAVMALSAIVAQLRQQYSAVVELTPAPEKVSL